MKGNDNKTKNIDVKIRYFFISIFYTKNEIETSCAWGGNRILQILYRFRIVLVGVPTSRDMLNLFDSHTQSAQALCSQARKKSHCDFFLMCLGWESNLTDSVQVSHRARRSTD